MLDDQEAVLSFVDRRVTDEMNVELTKPFVADEVKLALNQMQTTKAHGPDCMPTLFFQSYWHIVGDSITTAVLDSPNIGKLPSQLNHTLISLTPKKKTCELVSNYRPISLCNMIYKLVSKVIVNRMKAFLPAIILES